MSSIDPQDAVASATAVVCSSLASYPSSSDKIVLHAEIFVVTYP